MVMIKGWRDGTAYYLATDNPESVAAFAAFVVDFEYVDALV